MDAPTQTQRMTRAEYRAWAEGRPGRYELVRGEVIRRPKQRVFQVRAKGLIWLIFNREIEACGLCCQALPDGLAVEIGEDTEFEPMAMINCGRRIADDDFAAPNPVVVVDAVWPGPAAEDGHVRARDYFTVPSIQHYLIIRPDPDHVIHHRRGEAGVIESGVISEGRFRLDPPGIDVDVAEIFADT